MFLKTKTNTVLDVLVDSGRRIRRDFYNAGDIISVDAAAAVQLLNDGEAEATALTVAATPYRSSYIDNPTHGKSANQKFPPDEVGALVNDGHGGLTWSAVVGGGGTQSSMSDNGDGTFTHSDGAGVDVSFYGGPETITSLAYNAVSKTLTFTDEAGAVSSHDLSALGVDVFVNGGSFNATTAVLTLTDTDGVTPDVVLDLSSLKVNFADATTAADDATGSGGASTDAARSDHKHAAQGVSADAGNLLKAGTDGLHLLDPADLAQPADAVSPAADDATGAVGTGTEYAREDHKHPAQGVSADADNSLSAGTDGLHYFKEAVNELAVNPTTKELTHTDETGTAQNLDLSMTGADGTNPGAAGVVPQPGALDNEKFLRGDGTWADTGVPADAVSPAADDATGAVGTGTEYAREDHKHPAQGVSADADNRLSAGTDGLHYLGDMTAATAGTGGNAGAVPAAAAGDNTAFLRGDATWVDLPDGAITFVTNASINPAATGEPTDAEVLASLTAVQIGIYVWYNGTDAAGAGPSTATHAWFRDMTGALIRLHEPAGSGEATTESVNQASHGFAVMDAVYHNGTGWTKAQADSASSVAQAIVTEVMDASNFTITTHGKAAITSHGLTVGEYYWLDQATAGTPTASQPTSGIAQSVLHVRDVNTIMVDVGQAMTVDNTTAQAAEVFLGEASGLNGSHTVLNGGAEATWDAVIAEYEFVRFEFFGDTIYHSEHTLRTDRIVAGNVIYGTTSDASNNWYMFATLEATTGATLSLGSTNFSNIGVRVYGIRAQQVVIPANAITASDQTASGYFDFGDMRMQWGIHDLITDSAADVLFPAPFADTSTVITLGLSGDGENYSIATSGDIDVVIKMITGGLTTTKFSIDRDDDMQNTDNWKVHWHAIGRKP